MLGAMAVKITFEGDESDLVDSFKRVGDAGTGASTQLDKMDEALANIEEAAKRSADATETLASHAGGMNSLAEGFGNTERVASGVNDVLGVMAEQFGVNIGPAQEYAQSIADVGGGLEGIIGGGMALGKQLMGVPATLGPAIASTWAHVGALQAQAAATIAANLPLIAIIAAIALLAAGIVILVKNWDEIVEKFPVLGEVVETVKTKLNEFTGWITDTFIPAVASLYDPAIKVPLELIVAYFRTQFELVKVGVETVLGVIKGVVDVFMGVFTGDWDRAWSGVKQVVDSLWTGIKEAFNLGVKFLKEDLLPLIAEAGSALGGALKDGFVGGVKGTVGVIGNLADGLLTAIKSLINTAIDAVNGSIPNDLSLSIMGKSIGIDLPDNPIPHLASGLWNVPGPRGVDGFPAMLAGGEMVVPAPIAEGLRQLSGSPGFTVTLPGAGRSGTANNGDMTADQRRFVEQAMETWVQRLPEEIKRAVMAAWTSFQAGNLPLEKMLNILNNYMAMVPDIGPEPSIYPTAPSGPHPERGGGYGGGLPVPTGPPSLGGSGGTNGAGGNVPKTTPAGGVKADEELIGAVLEMLGEQKKSNTLLSKLIDILERPQVIDFMSRGDPRSLAALLAPFLVDAMAQVYRRQAGVARP